MSIFLNTTSRNIPAKDYSWDSVIYQTGRPLLDADVNLQGEILSSKIPSLPLPSGVLAYSPIRGDHAYIYNTTPNQLTIKPFTATVAGHKVYVAGTANGADGSNLVALPEPPSSAIDPATYNKMLFVFLECWRAEVAPSTSARVALRLENSLAEGDTVKFINPVGPSQILLTCGDEFQMGANAYETARNLAESINTIDPVDFSGLSIQAETKGSEIVVITFGAGSAGNNCSVQVFVPTVGTVSYTPSGGTDGLNKPAPLKAYKYGNVLCPSSLYLDDNIVDPLLLRESSRRIQIQYRIRVLDVDFDSNAHPEGFTHPDCFAQGVWGEDSTYNFSRVTGSENDAGLWRAGTGNQTSAFQLGTVDGYVYAIPLCMVSRRNSAGFDAVLNANGGVLSTLELPSDRPDGKYADLVYQDDVLDMMRHVYPFGLDYASETTYQFQSLLDQNYYTLLTFEDTAGSQTGTRSITPMVCDEIGQPITLGGIGDGSNRGNYIRTFDHIARRFGSQPIIEYLTFKLLPTASNPWLYVTKASGTNWFDGDEITLDLAELDPLSISNWTGGTGIHNYLTIFNYGYVIDVVDAWHNDGNVTTPISKKVEIASIRGLGGNQVYLILDRNRTETNTGYLVGDAGLGGDQGSANEIYIRFAVAYPAGAGLTQTPIHDGYASSETFPNGAYVEVDPANRPSDIAEGTAPYIHIRQGYRDVCAYYLVPMLELVTPEKDLVTLKLQHPIEYMLDFEPDVVDSLDNSLGYMVNQSKLGSTESIITLTDPRPFQDELTVTYYARMPLSLHENGYQMAIYYKACAKQSMYNSKFSLLGANPQPLVLKPLYVPPNLWVIQGGKGSVELGYPYYAPSEQISVREDQDSEGLLSATPRISLPDFNIDTGVVSLTSLLPLDISGNLTFNMLDYAEDEEGRAHFISTLDSAYRPMSIAMPLANYSSHKTALPFLARVVEDTPILRRGEVVMVVISRLSGLSKENKVVLSDGDDKTVASIYRTKNLMIVGD